MHIAVLGATSQIAKDFVRYLGERPYIELTLFARRPQAIIDWLANAPLKCKTVINAFADFGREMKPYDAIVNFVGSGNPAQTANMGASILDITYEFDSLALNYVQKFPSCRYIFLSSGAAYGGTFSAPAEENTSSSFPINKLLPADWYGAAKMLAECRHRALPALPIVDVRVFNYFSRTQDVSARFLISDMLRAIREETVLKVSSDYIVRDFIHPSDFSSLIEAILNTPPTNTVVDCYSNAPIDKPTLLSNMQEHFGLRYELVESDAGVNATGNKAHYYSLNKRASVFGYKPEMSSWSGILKEADAILNMKRVLGSKGDSNSYARNY